MRKIVLIILLFNFLASWGITLETKRIYRDLKSIYIKRDSTLAEYLSDSENEWVNEGNLFEVVDVFSEVTLDRNVGDFNTDFGLYFVTQRPISHPFLPGFLLIVEGRKTFYSVSTTDWLVRELFRLREEDNYEISDANLSTLLKYVVYPLGRKHLFTRLPEEVFTEGDIKFIKK